ncbi:GAF domain-containing sensor histidine kinase [Nocardioides sambongensis]|uniref:GAF domain-containing sensor histidine kinase n=1 Tax=Nocardioides sambongensis TaxID=2589074 RepID=UPI00112958A2|nr:GAF domain-containing sensor histidine kinase [Nocardioides sambongensis]
MPTDPSRPAPLPASTGALLDAILAISADLDLPSVLERIIRSAAELTGARYGALGVLDAPRPEEGLIEFVTTGLTPEEAARIGELPRGRGILGHLIRHPTALRLPDLSRHPDSVGFPPGHPPMTSFLGVPVRVRGSVFGNLYLTEKAGGRAFDADDETLVTALADVAGFVIEHAHAYGRSEQRRRWLEASARVTAVVDPDGTTSAAVQEIAAAAQAGARARAAALRPAPAGAPAPAPTAAVPTVAAPEADRAWVERLLGVVPPVPDADGTELVEHEVQGHLVVQLALRPHLADGGTLVVIDPQIEPGDHEWRDLLLSFADHAALTLDRLRALADRAELAVLSDRERIARDLHDLVIQRLFATGLQLQGTAIAAPTQVAAQLEQAVDALDQTIRDIRGTIFELRRPPAQSLQAAVRALVRELEPTLGLVPELTVSGPVDTLVEDDLAEPVLAVLREALTNVARHAGATRVRVSVDVDADRLVAQVTDDGVGLPPGPRCESGLANARRRADALAGACTVGPADGGGTVLRWWVPLR